MWLLHTDTDESSLQCVYSLQVSGFELGTSILSVDSTSSLVASPLWCWLLYGFYMHVGVRHCFIRVHQLLPPRTPAQPTASSPMLCSQGASK